MKNEQPYYNIMRSERKHKPNRLQANDVKQLILASDFYISALPEAIFKKHGWNDAGLCPFHNDTRAGSFYVNIETGAYKCFSCGASGGDIISYTIAMYQIEFAEAMAQLTDTWGL